MYCKNCGEEIDAQAAICVKCGYTNGTGTRYCGHCGKEVSEGQAICVTCGFYVNKPEKGNEEKTAQKSKAEALYAEYLPSVRKNIIFSILKSVLTIAIVLAVLFLPIYTCELDVSDLTMEELMQIEKPDNEEDLMDFLMEGKIKQNFSVFSDLKLLGEKFFDEEGEEFEALLLIEEGLFPLFILIMAVTLTIMAVKQLYSEIQELKDIDKTTLLTVNELKKSGSAQQKKNIFKQQTVYALFVYMIFDIIFSKVFGLLFDMEGLDFVRKMNSISGVSLWIILLLVLFVAYIFTENRKKKIENGLLLNITQKEYAEGGE